MIRFLMEQWPKAATRLFTFLIARQFGHRGVGCRIVPPFRYLDLQRVSLGDRVAIHRYCWLSTLSDGTPGNEKKIKLIIKSDTSIGMGATIAAAREIVIGEHVLMARNVYISDHGHAYEDINIPIEEQGIAGIAPVSIGAHTWLGQNACVMPGVIIGRHCVVGANSVVNRSVPDFSVVVGAPARVVRQYNPQTGAWEKTC